MELCLANVRLRILTNPLEIFSPFAGWFQWNICAHETIRVAFHGLLNNIYSASIIAVVMLTKSSSTIFLFSNCSPFVPLCINHQPPSPCWHPLHPVSEPPSNVTHVGRRIPQQLPAAGRAWSLPCWVKQSWHSHACSEKETRPSRNSRYDAST